MGSRAAATSSAIFILLNILFFTAVSSTNPSTGCTTPTTPKIPSIPKTPSTPKIRPAPTTATCPKDTLKLGACVNLLDDLVHVVVGSTYKPQCCSLISGLADLDAAVCLCTVIKANALGINLTIPVKLSLLLNQCGKSVPSGYLCA